LTALLIGVSHEADLVQVIFLLVQVHLEHPSLTVSPSGMVMPPAEHVGRQAIKVHMAWPLEQKHVLQPSLNDVPLG
jgi:hypothetical protein